MDNFNIFKLFIVSKNLLASSCITVVTLANLEQYIISQPAQPDRPKKVNLITIVFRWAQDLRGLLLQFQFMIRSLSSSSGFVGGHCCPTLSVATYCRPGVINWSRVRACEYLLQNVTDFSEVTHTPQRSSPSCVTVASLHGGGHDGNVAAADKVLNRGKLTSNCNLLQKEGSSSTTTTTIRNTNHGPTSRHKVLKRVYPLSGQRIPMQQNDAIKLAKWDFFDQRALFWCKLSKSTVLPVFLTFSPFKCLG